MQTTANKTVNRTVKPRIDAITLHTEALQIYNIMPKGSRELAAQKYGCAVWYFKDMITNPKTDVSKMLSIVECIIDASKEHTVTMNLADVELKKTANKFIKKYL